MLILDLLVILLVLAWMLGFRLNTTPSLPEGIYQISSEGVQRGDLVTFCLDADNHFTRLADEREYLGSGSCPSGLRPLIKKLIGLPGDDLRITDEGLILNGRFLPGTSRFDHDRQGRPLPPSWLYEGFIPAGFGLVLSQEHIGSFDSRYFGVVPLSSLTKIKPIAIVGRQKTTTEAVERINEISSFISTPYADETKKEGLCMKNTENAAKHMSAMEY